MAVPINKGVMPGGGLHKAFIAAVAERYALNPADFMHMQERVMDQAYEVAFKAPRLPDPIQAQTRAVLRVLQEPMRGAVICAAVPDFVAAVQKLLDQITNAGPVHILVPQNEVDSLIRKYKYGPYPNINPRTDGAAQRVAPPQQTTGDDGADLSALRPR